MSECIDVLSTIGEARRLPLREDDGGLVLHFTGGAGLYQFSVIADAREFDWEQLYYPLHKYGNKGQRTGPWDFDLRHENKPLVPSYWVDVDGRRIGLWFFQRVSLEDIDHKRFRGKTAFRVPQAGEHELRLTPYQSVNIRWSSARIEVDPDDRLVPLPKGMKDAPGNVAAAAWTDEVFRELQRHALETTHAFYRAALERSFDWAMRQERKYAEDIPLLVAAHCLEGRPAAIENALELLDHFLALPCWGNPNPEGYGHNGDMHAGMTFRALAMAYHMIGDGLGEVRRKRLLDKLALQGNAFLDQALLNRDYWGGSLLQDHGWVSMFAFGAGVLHLLGVLPEARTWAEYIIPRLDRSLAAMPRDGVIPRSSYYSLDYYTDEPTHYRDALRALSERDIFDEAPVREIVPYLKAVTDESDCTMQIVLHGDKKKLSGGHAFLNAMALKYRDRDAARFHRLLAEQPEFESYHSRQRADFFQDPLWGFMSYRPTVKPADAETGPRRHLLHFDDSGLVHYRDDALGVVLALRCAPTNGYHADPRADCPCDHLASVPADGHFALHVHGVPLLVTPDFGYRLHSFMRTCLLVDGEGQYGDVGYPMSIPDWQDRGSRVDSVRWDQATGAGVARLDLRLAYPDELGMAEYTREFVFTRERRIIVRDTVLFDGPHSLSWLFQGKRESGVALGDGMTSTFGTKPQVRIEPRSFGLDLQAAVTETDVVWAYSSTAGFKPFDHVRYDTTRPTESAVVEFHMTW